MLFPFFSRSFMDDYSLETFEKKVFILKSSSNLEKRPIIVTNAQKKDVKVGNSAYCGNVTGVLL